VVKPVSVTVPAPVVTSALFWRARALVRFSTPPLTVVVPLKVLAALRVVVPDARLG
jgi:hypothetical protein